MIRCENVCFFVQAIKSHKIKSDLGAVFVLFQSLKNITYKIKVMVFKKNNFSHKII